MLDSRDCSLLAHLSLEKHLGAIRRKIFEAIKATGKVGAIAQEIEIALGMSRSTVSMRFSELKRNGYIDAVGIRQTTARRNAVVYIAVADNCDG